MIYWKYFRQFIEGVACGPQPGGPGFEPADQLDLEHHYFISCLQLITGQFCIHTCYPDFIWSPLFRCIVGNKKPSFEERWQKQQDCFSLQNSKYMLYSLIQPVYTCSHLVINETENKIKKRFSYWYYYYYYSYCWSGHRLSTPDPGYVHVHIYEFWRLY